MKTAVRYYSRSGNTRKLAQAIAVAAGTNAETTAVGLIEAVDLLFLGGALYAGGIDKKLERFIRSLSGETVKALAVFSTSAGGKSIQGHVTELLKGTNISLINEGFSCKGKFLFTNRGRPNEQDLAAVTLFAKACLTSTIVKKPE